MENPTPPRHHRGHLHITADVDATRSYAAANDAVFIESFDALIELEPGKVVVADVDAVDPNHLQMIAMRYRGLGLGCIIAARAADDVPGPVANNLATHA